MRGLLLAVLLGAGLLACAGPPPDAYVGGSLRSSGAVGLGKDAAGEACTIQTQAGGADIFCGTWDQPSGHVLKGEAGTDLRQAATASRWRSAIDNRFDCNDPAASSILGGSPALVLTCRRKVGGWPQAVFAANVDGQVYLADGILPALPVLERAVGVLAGKVTAQAAAALPPGQADALLASRLAAQSFSAGDIGQFQTLMTAGTRANLAESFVAAERAYRAALALQQKALGANDPGTAVPLMLVALQVSNEGRTAEADDGFARAAKLVPGASDPTAQPRLWHYQALNDINENKPADALPLLAKAEAGYAAVLPAELLANRPAPVQQPLAISRRSGGAAVAASDNVLLEPEQQTALVGVIETRRYEAIVLRELGRPDEAKAMIRSAEALSASRGLRQRDLTARLSRTASLIDDRAETGSGYGGIQRASRDFAIAQPGTRPLAQTELLQAAQDLRAGSVGNALDLCRRATALLRELKTATSVALMAPCLSAYAAVARDRPAERQALWGEMFESSQVVQGGITIEQIAQASARLIETAKDARVGDAIRRQQDASVTLADLQQQADALSEQGPGRRGAPAPEELRKQVEAARATLADADAALQVAAPNYGQLVQEVVSAGDVLKALAPGEAFVSVSLNEAGGWVFLLRDGQVTVAPTVGGTAEIGALVQRVRSTVEPAGDTPPPFDIAAAQALYTDTLGQAGGQAGAGLEGIDSVVVAPTGPLLSLPFSLLLTGPASQSSLAAAPWLVRQVAVSHVPAAANFVSLRKAAASARAGRPWYGFGDFRPVTLGQAERIFPSGVCEDSAKLFAGLPPLPFARRELEAARLLLGGSAADELEGVAFNAPQVLKEDLRPYRILHFATHALLPSDLRCQTEPAIVTSDPPGAVSARGALLTSSDVMTMQLDADVVILSACNSGGPNGASSGESLSGLARAFFYAGARALMVTHWSVNDQATALLVAGTMQRIRQGDRLGAAGALRGAQLSMLDDAGKRLPAAIAHPFYWAPFALVGEGRGRTVSADAGQRVVAGP